MTVLAPVQAQTAADAKVSALLPSTAIGDGYALPYAWADVPGADTAEVTGGSVAITSAPAEETAQLTAAPDGNGLIITVPPHVDVASLSLVGLYRVAGDRRVDIRSNADLNGRLAVALAAKSGGGFDAPAYTVPPVNAHGSVPRTLTGASMSYTPEAALRLPPGVRAGRIRLSLVTGDAPEEFQEQPFGVDKVYGRLVRPPRDLVLTGPDGTKALDVPGEQPAGRAFDVDLVPPAGKLLSAALSAGQPLAGTFTLKGAAESFVTVKYVHVRGNLVRTVHGVHSTVLEGDPLPPAGFTGLAAEQPTEVTGDLTIAYQGLCVLRDQSDAVPAQQGGVSGPVLVPGGPAVTRPLPPAGLPNPLARIGLIGRADQDCALTLTLLRADGQPLAPAAQVQPPAAGRVGVCWIAFDTPVPVTEAVIVSVEATRGRFLWAASPQPLVRLAVADPAPPASPVTLAGTTLAAVGAEGVHMPGFAFPPAAFAGAIGALESDLFVRVDLSDVEMRYRR